MLVADVVSKLSGLEGFFYTVVGFASACVFAVALVVLIFFLKGTKPVAVGVKK